MRFDGYNHPRVVSDLEFIDCIFCLCLTALDNVNGGRKSLLDTVNCKGSVCMQSADMVLIRVPIKNDIASMPVLYAKDYVFTVQRPQRANIMTRTRRKLSTKSIGPETGKRNLSDVMVWVRKTYTIYCGCFGSAPRRSFGALTALSTPRFSESFPRPCQ